MPIPPYITEQREREVQQALRLLGAHLHLKRSDIHCEDACPICLVPFGSIFDEQMAAEKKQEGISSQSVAGSSASEEMLGVVKLSGCGHIFCRRDLAEWIESHHGSCPSCRRIFFAFTPIDEAEYESSDGGEYVPGEDDDDDDGFTDDGDLDLLPTSDFDLDLDMDDSFFTSPAEVPPPRIALAGSDFRVYMGDDEDAELDELDGDYDVDAEEEGIQSETGGLSYGSDSLSSEDASVSTDDGAEAYAADVSMVSGGCSVDDDELLSDASNYAEVKSLGSAPTEQSNPSVTQ